MPRDIAVAPPRPRASPVGQAAARCNPTKSEELVTAVQCVLELGEVHVTVGMGALFWELSYLAKLKSCPKDKVYQASWAKPI